MQQMWTETISQRGVLKTDRVPVNIFRFLGNTTLGRLFFCAELGLELHRSKDPPLLKRKERIHEAKELKVLIGLCFTEKIRHFF